jgi:hypothetical protein
MTPTTTLAELRLAAIDSVPRLSPDARRIMKALAIEVTVFAGGDEAFFANKDDLREVALQMFEAAIAAAGGHYHEG